MTIEQLLGEIESGLPGYSWLIRNDDPGRYFAHVYDEHAGMGAYGYAVSSISYANSAAKALEEAMHNAIEARSIAGDDKESRND